MADSVNALLRMHPGSLLYGRVQNEDGSWEVVFGLREEPQRIKNLGAEPEIEIRPGVIYEYGVLLLPVFIRLGPLSRESLFLTWINAHEPAGMETLRLLSAQPRITIQLYGDRPEPEQSLSAPNPHQVFLTDTLRDMEAAPSWNVSQFEAAKILLFQRRPTAMDIWWSI